MQAEWGLTDPEMRDLVNAGAVDLVAATVAAGAPAAEARSWWVVYLAQQANDRGVELDELPITPAQVAQVIALVASGELTNKLARQVVDGVLAGEGDAGRGRRSAAAWRWSSDDAALVSGGRRGAGRAARRRGEDPRRQGARRRARSSAR